MSVDFENDRYHLESKAWFAASRDDLYRTLTNYDLFEKFTSAFVETRNLTPDDEGRPRFFTRLEGCVLFFCKSMRRSGHLELTPPSQIIAVTHADDSSDFSFSRERWVLEEDGDGTMMTYYFEMQPAFWVPPVVGPYMIKRTLREGGIDAVDRIEAVARGEEPKR